METPITAAALGGTLIILQQVLMMITGTYRGKVSVGVGFGTDQKLERLIRRHGNLAENAAIFVVVLALAEGLFGGGVLITLFALVFLIARICHVIAFSNIAGSHGQENGPRLYPMMRLIGALFSGVSGITLGLYVLVMLAVS